MLKRKLAISIVEAMVIMLIITVGLVGVYGIYSSSQRMVTNVGNRIEATQIAKEGLEAVMNIRDTNWLLFPSDMKHCWKTLSYDRDCICDSADCSAFIVPNLIKDGSYKIYRNENGRWLLEKQENVTITSGDYVNPDYRDFYRIGLDNNGLYTQKEGEIETEILPVFTREIIVESVEAYAGEEIDPITFSHNNAIKIISLVKWVDSARPEPQEIRLESILTNWQGEK